VFLFSAQRCSGFGLRRAVVVGGCSRFRFDKRL
jgi:hypothetical protein